jgi:hypothetical protein
MNDDQLAKTLADHALSLLGDPAGVLADFSGADLRHANLRYADLSGADFSNADLTGADLTGARFRCSDLRGAKLSGVDLRGAKLRGAELRGFDLRGFDLRGVDLSGADLSTHVVGHGQIATFGLRYWAMTTRDDRGVRRLQYGCETLTLDGWEMLAGDLASAHHPHEADIYERETRALVALCRTMDEVKQ